MWSFLSDLVRAPGTARTVVVMDEELSRSRRYRLLPKRLLLVWAGTLLLAGLVVTGLLAFTPLGTILPGYGTEELQRSARLNSVRVSALQDSVAVQRDYIRRLRTLMTGAVDSLPPAPPPSGRRIERRRPATDVPSVLAAAPENEQERRYDRFSFSGTEAPPPTPPERPGALSSLDIPAPSPVETGFPTRGINEQEAHYGIDVAVSEGMQVRAVGDGTVILADWIRDGGHTIAVQHADGYVSVYKHNKRLLKEVGDRVQPREALAVSGNTGEVTSGPHLHFELWREGRPQDPRSHVAGW